MEADIVTPAVVPRSSSTTKLANKPTSTELTRWLNPNQFKWMLSGASWITETQTYYLIGDDGSFCMVQMAYELNVQSAVF